jgi:cell division GTPase FtsZ
MGARVVVFTQFPFEFEYKNRITDAEDCRVLLDQIVDIIHLFSADETMRDKKTIPLPKAFSLLDEFLAGKVLDWMRNM